MTINSVALSIVHGSSYGNPRHLTKLVVLCGLSLAMRVSLIVICRVGKMAICSRFFMCNSEVESCIHLFLQCPNLVFILKPFQGIFCRAIHSEIAKVDNEAYQISQKHLSLYNGNPVLLFLHRGFLTCKMPQLLAPSQCQAALFLLHKVYLPIQFLMLKLIINLCFTSVFTKLNFKIFLIKG